MGREVVQVGSGAAFRPRPFVLFVAAGLALMGVAACARHRSESTPPRGATPAAATLAPDTLANGLRRDSAVSLESWCAMWRAAAPGFVPDSLLRAGRAPALRSGFVQPAKDWYPPPPEQEAAYAVLSADSPGGRYKLIFDEYQDVGEYEGKVDIGGDVDSAPLLLDLRLGTADRFAFCGTGCGFHWGCWLDSTRFAIAGTTTMEPDDGSVRGFVSVYSLVDSTETRYLTPPVSPDLWRPYGTAWEAWVAARYRTWKASRSRS